MLHSTSKVKRVTLSIGDINQQELQFNDGGFLAATGKPSILETKGGCTNLGALERFVQLQDLRSINLSRPIGRLDPTIHLEKLKKVRLSPSELGIDALRGLLGHAQQLEHFELYQRHSMTSTGHRPSLETILECLRPHARTLTTFGFSLAARGESVSRPVIDTLAGFPNIRALALDSRCLQENSSFQFADLLGLLHNMKNTMENLCLFDLAKIDGDEFRAFTDSIIHWDKRPKRILFWVHPHVTMSDSRDLVRLRVAGIQVALRYTSSYCSEPEHWMEDDWMKDE